MYSIEEMAKESIDSVKTPTKRASGFGRSITWSTAAWQVSTSHWVAEPAWGLRAAACLSAHPAQWLPPMGPMAGPSVWTSFLVTLPVAGRPQPSPAPVPRPQTPASGLPAVWAVDVLLPGEPARPPSKHNGSVVDLETQLTVNKGF